MKALSLFAVLLTLGLSVGITDAEAARRMGGGKSFGMQRQMTPPTKAPTAAPAQTPSAASTAAAAPGAAAAQAPKRSWMGPVAGLAAGLGLAALASHLGFGGELASMLMLGLLVMAVIAVVGFLMRKRTPGRSPAMAGAGGLQYRESPTDYASPTEKSNVLSMPGSSAGVDAPSARNIPSDFDVAGFVRNAKVNFIRLQAANDAGNLEDIREFTTPEMFAEIKMDFAERHGAAQETDVVSLDADVLEVAEESTRYVVSVRFTGLVREDKDAAAEPIDEIWHLVKPREGKGGWLLAGIQQTQ